MVMVKVATEMNQNLKILIELSVSVEFLDLIAINSEEIKKI